MRLAVLVVVGAAVVDDLLGMGTVLRFLAAPRFGPAALRFVQVLIEPATIALAFHLWAFWGVWKDHRSAMIPLGSAGVAGLVRVAYLPLFDRLVSSGSVDIPAAYIKIGPVTVIEGTLVLVNIAAAVLAWYVLRSRKQVASTPHAHQDKATAA